MLTREVITDWFKSLQNTICIALENADGTSTFSKEDWSRPEGGGGITRVITDGDVIEKGGVNFSAVHGVIPSFLLNEIKNGNSSNKLNPSTFYATGVSIVIHPKNPMVPIIHMNVRYFEMPSDTGTICWFGGGIDLTPHYVVEEDARYFHKMLKQACDQHNPLYYSDFKKWADDYFFIEHRKETRGVGGIFFDKLSETKEITLEQRFNFVKTIGNTFAPVYTALISKNKNLPFDENEKQWQMLRRGRYVEFNLVYDRGTKFGLETNGRIESILMSLPTTASWLYNYTPQPKSEEEKTLLLLKKGVNWI